ncbi:hypothetical protein Scep_018705 [Stephania cephalantha]|uniref:Uncharacterized protein n=1 Tax=Stephania cephalantha TaxID=152367 RepID=A0AAP0I9E6_9MAGN
MEGREGRRRRERARQRWWRRAGRMRRGNGDVDGVDTYEGLFRQLLTVHSVECGDPSSANTPKSAPPNQHTQKPNQYSNQNKAFTHHRLHRRGVVERGDRAMNAARRSSSSLSVSVDSTTDSTAEELSNQPNPKEGEDLVFHLIEREKGEGEKRGERGERRGRDERGERREAGERGERPGRDECWSCNLN